MSKSLLEEPKCCKAETRGGIQVLIIELVEFGLEMSALDSRSININGTERDSFRFPTRIITYSCFNFLLTEANYVINCVQKRPSPPLPFPSLTELTTG